MWGKSALGAYQYTLFLSQHLYSTSFWNAGQIFGVVSLFSVVLFCLLLEWLVDSSDERKTLSHAICLLAVSTFFLRIILFGDTFFLHPRRIDRGHHRHGWDPSWRFPGGFLPTTTKLPLDRRIGSSMTIIVRWEFLELMVICSVSVCVISMVRYQNLLGRQSY